jgi:hypothetical protein
MRLAWSHVASEVADVIGEVGSVAVGEMNRTKVRVTRTVGEHVGGGGEDRGRQPNSGLLGPAPRLEAGPVISRLTPPAPIVVA